MVKQTAPQKLEQLLTAADITRLLKISRITLYAWRKAGRFPEGFQFGGATRLRWRERDVVAWIDQQPPVRPSGVA